MATLATSARLAPTGLLARWHLLSLDGPTVAALWTWFVARSARVELPWALPPAMFLAVWLLYAIDRLLDSRYAYEDSRRLDDLELRHLFHRAHRKKFQVGIVAALFVLLPLLMVILLRAGTTFACYAGLGLLLAGWFALVHRPGRIRAAPKELMTALFFAAAVFLPAFVRASGLRLPMLTIAGCFAMMCWLNCLFIFHWEHAQAGGAHITTRAGVRWLGALSMAAAIAPLVLAELLRAWALPMLLATSLAIAGLMLLDRWRGSLERTTLRAAADLVLLTPMLFLPLLK